MDGMIEPLAAPNLNPSPNAPQADRELVKVSMNFTPQTVDVLRELSRLSGVTMTEIARRGIGLQKFITQEIAAGSSVLIKDVKGKMRQLILP